MSDLSQVFAKFRKSLGWEPTVVKVNVVACPTCGALHREGVPCKNCGDTGNPEDELGILQRFVKSLRARNVVNVRKLVDWSSTLQTCVFCGSQFSRTLDVCPHCNRKVPDDKERFLRSLAK